MAASAPRGRGHPRRNPANPSHSNDENSQTQKNEIIAVLDYEPREREATTMVVSAPRGRGRPPRNPANPSLSNDENSQAQARTQARTQTQKNATIVVSEYEQSREERIKQNLEKMQKLGIFDLSLQLKSRTIRTPKNTNLNNHKTPLSISLLQPSGPIRRSSRLKNAMPVTYSEVDLAKKDKELGYDKSIQIEAGSNPEIYTEEHEKLLGNTEKSWMLFVDGYGSDGKRIYDSVKGKTCHQCRQKTLGYRTHCSSCNMVQGQFCGDCLYMRYGEHVLEAIENPNWICPVCRGICNCSLCRQAKGWAPTGTLYKKISSLGFKSVAHYLIQTHRLETKLGDNRDTTKEFPVKRSLPFSDMSVLSEEPRKVSNDHPGSPEVHKHKTDDESKNDDDNQNSVKRAMPFTDMRQDSENIGSLEVVDHKFDDLLGSSKHRHQNEMHNTCESKKDEVSIVSRSITDQADNEFPKTEGNVLDGKQAVKGISLEMEIDGENDTAELKEISTDIAVVNNDDKLLGVGDKISDVNQAGEGEEVKEVLPSGVKHHVDENTLFERSPKPKRKRVQPSFDTIGGRVRRMRKSCHSMMTGRDC